jgi:hypothetical protein
MKKRLILLLILVLTLSTSAFAFYDTDDSKTAYQDAIDFLSDEGIISGYPDGSFKPDKTLNRAELLKIIVEGSFLLDNRSPSILASYSDDTCFHDVPTNQWYTKYVCFAKTSGWVEGYNDGTFRPAQTVSFVEGLKITLQGLDIPYSENTQVWYEDLVDVAATHNFIPHQIEAFNDGLKRDQMADLITRIVKDNEGRLDDYLGERDAINISYDELNATPVIIYTEKVREDSSGSRYYPTLRVYRKVGSQSPEVLIDEIGGVGEYPNYFMLSPDESKLLINLESRLVELDLQTKETRDLFFPRQQVNSIRYSEDEEYLYIVDEKYAKGDYKVYFTKLDLDDLSTEILHEDEVDGNHYFISKVRDDNIILLMVSWGEAGVPWYLDLNKNELKQVPDQGPQVFMNYSTNGEYLSVANEDWVDLPCGEFFGSRPSFLELRDPITGDLVTTFGKHGKVVNIETFSPDDSEILYSAYPPLTANHCDDDPDKSYYRMQTKAPYSTTQIYDPGSLKRIWDPTYSDDFEFRYIDSSSAWYFKGQRVPLPTKSYNVRAYYVE